MRDIHKQYDQKMRILREQQLQYQQKKQQMLSEIQKEYTELSNMQKQIINEEKKEKEKRKLNIDL